MKAPTNDKIEHKTRTKQSDTLDYIVKNDTINLTNCWEQGN